MYYILFIPNTVYWKMFMSQKLYKKCFCETSYFCRVSQVNWPMGT